MPDNYFSRLGLDGSKLAALIDAINGVSSKSLWATDIDQSGSTGPADITRLIDNVYVSKIETAACE